MYIRSIWNINFMFELGSHPPNELTDYMQMFPKHKSRKIANQNTSALEPSYSQMLSLDLFPDRHVHSSLLHFFSSF